MLTLVTGATGFLGRRVVQELLGRRHEVRCLVHVPGRERLFDHRLVEVHYGNVLEPESLAAAFYDVEAVVHLVAIIRPTRRLTFDLVNRLGTANVVAAARDAGVRDFQHVSAIGAGSDRSYPFLFSKWQAEREVINSGLPYTIIRPSLLFGEGDEFLTALAALIRVFPLVPVLGAGSNRLQPVAADDIARCIGMSVGRQDLKGRVLALGGPQRLSYNEVLTEVALAMDKRRKKVHLPVAPAYVAAAILQRLVAKAPITTDQIRMLGIRNVAEADGVERAFGFTPRRLRGNIDFVNSVGFMDGLGMVLGFPPSRPVP